jgi:hypothetical protein
MRITSWEKVKVKENNIIISRDKFFIRYFEKYCRCLIKIIEKKGAL